MSAAQTIIRLRMLPSVPADQTEFRYDSGTIQWKLVSATTWNDLVTGTTLTTEAITAQGPAIKTAYEGEANTNAFTDSEKTKLAGLTAGAEPNQTPAQMLASLLTVDGSGSGLDADLLDGQEASAFSTPAATETLTNKSIDAANNTVTGIGSSEVIADIITGLTAETTPAAGDFFIMYDASGTALRKVDFSDMPGGGSAPETGTVAQAETATDTTQRTWPATAFAVRGPVPDAILYEEQAFGTDAGTASSGIQTRVLNGEVDPDSLVTLSTNQFTPTVAMYCEFRAPAYRVGRHAVFLENVTDTTIVASGTAQLSGTSDAAQSFSEGSATLIAGKTYRLRHECDAGRASDGLGAGLTSGPTGGANRYTEVRLWRV